LLKTDTCVNGTDNSGRPNAPKEVDSVNSIQTRKTAIEILSTPSTFGMPFGVPACGHASTGINAVPDAVRVKGDMGLAVRTYAQGTIAWSPPS
jgi:hypothetical protein